MKRKNDQVSGANGTNGAPPAKKRAMSDDEAHASFRKNLFDADVLEEYRGAYAKSQPYLHGVIPDLISPTLLRKVRTEIRDNISFQSKETDIYKIEQSGDLANLDGLDDKSLRLLPSLLTLRDALYSSAFRKYISTVANSGPLSGVKTDMAVNVYTPGCHLLCHDDVIGSRRVSYILYLLDPDIPWKPEWGGALRLYPTETFQSADGTDVKVPKADFTVSIPPAFNQLSFFTVQPGESFHDVEEVYHRGPTDSEDDGGRVRMAISGWFHIPQEGEEGYEPGLEEKLAERSSLQQLEGKSSEFDLPQAQWKTYDPEISNPQDLKQEGLDTEELDFLLRFISHQYLVPSMLKKMRKRFKQDAFLQLLAILNPKFATPLREYISSHDSSSSSTSPSTEHPSIPPNVSRPPHKHRFLYQQPTEPSESPTPYDDLLSTLFPSLTFRKWLTLATGLPLTASNTLARRFRRGKDYSLATAYEEEEPQLEVCLNVTPTTGWGGEDEEGEVGGEKGKEEDGKEKEEKKEEGKETNGSTAEQKGVEKELEPEKEFESVGGYEVYMAADDDEDSSSETASNHGVEIPAGAAKGQSSATGGGKRRNVDPAVYRSSGPGEDDAVLFSSTAAWNTMGIALRDRGTLKFVKYVSARAKGDRWDVCGEWQLAEEDEEDEADEDEESSSEEEDEEEGSEEDEGDEGEEGEEGEEDNEADEEKKEKSGEEVAGK